MLHLLLGSSGGLLGEGEEEGPRIGLLDLSLLREIRDGGEEEEEDGS